MKNCENMCTESMEVELSDITGISGVANIKDLHIVGHYTDLVKL